MCGICGWALPDSNAIPNREILSAMCEPLVNRGPDEEGLCMARGCGLGHRRLKVMDLDSGQQPMRDVTGRYVLVYNGEIYNFVQLRQELTAAGYIFTSSCDTEVLLYGLLHEGLQFLHKVNGMFAFALWDSAERELLLARDRFGVKPLYWAAPPEKGLFFASEASSLTASGLIPCAIDHKSLAAYLALSYIPGGHSIYRGVHRLLPGGWLRYSSEKGLRKGEWWDLAKVWSESRQAQPSVADWNEAFSALLSDAVKIRLQSDVPLGAFLSGGLDSSTLVAVMRNFVPHVRTFTARFTDASHDEGPLAAKTARLLYVEYIEETADIHSVETLLDIAEHLDEPFADTSILPMYSLCNKTRQYVTVALTGDGADELLGGYITLHADALYARMRNLPHVLIRLLRRMVNLLPDSHAKLHFSFKLKQFFAAFPRSTVEAHACWRLLFSPEELGSLFHGYGQLPDVFAPFRAAWEEAAELPFLDRLLYVDYKTWLADDILFKTDRASMRHSLELRSPFLDWRLVRLCAGMPPSLKRQGGMGKIILRNTARKLLPPSVLRHPKRGFNAPVARLLCTDWREVVEDAFQKQRLESGGLIPEYICKLWREHIARKKNHCFKLFTVLLYQLWLAKHKAVSV